MDETTTIPSRARDRATLIRRGSRKKPHLRDEPVRLLLRTRLRSMKSASFPWKPSTVLTLSRNFFGRLLRISATCPLYGVIAMASHPLLRSSSRCLAVNLASALLQYDLARKLSVPFRISANRSLSEFSPKTPWEMCIHNTVFLL